MAISTHPIAWLHAALRSASAAGPPDPGAERLLRTLLERQAVHVSSPATGVLEAEFRGPISAVECARRMQQALERFNEAHCPAGVGLSVAVDAGEAADAEAGARRLGAGGRHGDILVSPLAKSFLDPYLWGLCTLPTRGGAPEEPGVARVEWNPAIPTRSRAERQETVFLDILLEETSIQISLNEGDEISGALTYYDESPLEPARLQQLVESIQQNFRLANALAGGNADCLATLRRHGTELYDLLFNSELKQHLARITAEYLVLNLNERAVAVPWELLFDGREFLCRRFAMGRVVRTAQRPIGKARPAPICATLLVLSNPRGDLPSASQEGLIIRNEFLHSPRMQVHLLNGAVERREAVEVLREHDILHYCGHARYVEGKPEETGWVLADGKLTVADITQRLAGGEKLFPSLVFCNACQSGVTGAWERERMADSLAQAFLLAGVQHYVGAFWDVLDAPSGDMAVAFYRRLASGQSIGKALLSARERLAADRGESHLIWAAYVLYGDPRRIFFGAAESPAGMADRMLYGQESLAPALEPAGAGTTRSLPATPARATVPGWLLVLALLALIVAGIPFGLWVGQILNPGGGATVAAGSPAADFSEGLALYRDKDYAGALHVFRRQQALRPADPVLAGLVRAAENRSLEAARKERQQRVDSLLDDIARLMRAAPGAPGRVAAWG